MGTDPLSQEDVKGVDSRPSHLQWVHTYAEHPMFRYVPVHVPRRAVPPSPCHQERRAVESMAGLAG